MLVVRLDCARRRRSGRHGSAYDMSVGHADSFVCFVEKVLPHIEVFEDKFWDVDLAFEASGGL